MNSESIAIFLAAARTGSFTAAADEMYITKQLVSRSIQTMEQELGCALVTRNTHAFTLTRAGKQYRDFFLRHADEVCVPLCGRLNPLRIAVDQWIEISDPLVDALRSFERENECRVSILRTDQRQSLSMVLSGDAEYAITSHYLTCPFSSSLSIIPFREQELVYALSAEFSDALQMTWQEREHIPLLTGYCWEQTSEAVIAREKEFCSRFDFYPADIRVFQNQASITANVQLGAGASIVPFRPAEKRILQIPVYETSTITLSGKASDSTGRLDLLAHTLQSYFAADQVTAHEK